METLAPTPPPPSPHAVPQALDAALTALEDPPDLVVINDPQRGTQSEAVLELLFDQRKIRPPPLLVACGSHTFPEKEKNDFHSRFSRWVPPDRICWHNARAPDLVPLIGTPPWRVHPALARAQRILAVGSVEPHYFAGLSGAHKTLTIGCASFADIECNHARALHPNCRPGRLHGNPVHQGIVCMLDCLAQDRRLAAVNLLECEGTIRTAAGGDPLDALTELVPQVEQTWIRTIPQPADGLILEVEGPLAASFYQAEKAIKNNEWAVRNGGALFLVAPCQKGIGQAAFVSLLTQSRNYADALEWIKTHGYHLGDHKAVRLRYLTDPNGRGVRIFVLSPGLSPSDCQALGVFPIRSIEEGLQQSGLNRLGAILYRVRDAAFTCVQTDPQQQEKNENSP